MHWQLEGLVMAMGYRLQDDAYKALPALLERDYGVRVQGRLKRGYLNDARGRPLEVNILGDAIWEGEPGTIIGESKSQLSAPEIERFIRRRLQPLQQGLPRVFPVLVTHMVSGPEVDDYARQRGIALFEDMGQRF